MSDKRLLRRVEICSNILKVLGFIGMVIFYFKRGDVLLAFSSAFVLAGLLIDVAMNPILEDEVE